jgi:tetratricopeptide (TPR) repeat protein
VDFVTLLTLLGVIATAFVPLIGYLVKQRKELRNYYSVIWKSSKKLTPREVLGERPFYSFYQKRKEDAQLQQIISRKENVLLTGPPLSGKSRAFFEYLKASPKSYDVIIPRSVSMQSFQYPKDFRFWKDRIIYIEDLQAYIDKQDYYHLLFKASGSKKVILIASCHSGKQLKTLKNKLVEHQQDINTIFGDNVIDFGTISHAEGEHIAGKTGVTWDKVKFNGTIGSIFMRLSEMEKRYDQCSIIEKTILRSIRNLYICGLYNDNDTYSLDWIKLTAMSFELEGKDFEWTGWLKQLEEKEFIHVIRRNKIFAEDAYLETIVKPEIPVRNVDVFGEMIEVFKDNPDALISLGEKAYSVGGVDIEITDYMKSAIQAGDYALKTVNKENVLQIAKILRMIGASYWKLSKVEDTLRNCTEAGKYLSKAFEYLTPQTYPVEYATVKNTLGNVYCSLAEIEKAAENIKTGISHYEDAIKYLEYSGVDNSYAVTLNNLGAAYLILSYSENPAENQKKAIEIFSKSLEISERNKFQLYSALTLNNLGNSYSMLSEYEEPVNNLNKAIAYYDRTLEYYVKEKYPMHFALTKHNIGNALSMLAKFDSKNGESFCMEAIEAYKKALEIRTPDKFPRSYATTMDNLGDAYIELAKFKNPEENCYKALDAFEEVLSVRRPEENPFYHALVCYHKGKAYSLLAEYEDKTENYNKALEAFDESLKVFTETEYPAYYNKVQNKISQLKKIFFK